MNIIVGTNKISEEASQAIKGAEGSIEGTQNSDVALVKLPDKAEVSYSDSSGAHIVLPTGQVLWFTRAWKTDDCALDLCQGVAP